MPRPLPASPQMSVEQIEAHLKKESENYKNIEFTGAYKYPEFSAQEMYIKIQAANANLAALNLDRGITYLLPHDEKKLIAAAEESLAFLKDNFLCEKTQQSLAKQLGIYYAYYKGWCNEAKTKIILFIDHSENTLEYAQNFLHLAYAKALEENFHEEDDLQTAVVYLNTLAENKPISLPEEISILMEKGHAAFLLCLMNYRQSCLINPTVYLEPDAEFLLRAAAYLQQAIDYQTEALSKIEDNIELTTQVMSELTMSYRLASVIHYKRNDTAQTAEALKISQAIAIQVVANLPTIQAKGCLVRLAEIPDANARREFNNITLSAALNTGSTPVDAGMFSGNIQIPTPATTHTPPAPLPNPR